MKELFKKLNTLHSLRLIAFIFYLIVLVWGIVFKCNMMDGIFETYRINMSKTLEERFLDFIVPFGVYSYGFPLKELFVRDDILNTIAFIPIGFYVSYFAKKHKALKAILVGFSLSLTFELLQLFTLIGTFTSNDLITNSCGAIIGFVIYIILSKVKSEKLLKLCAAIFAVIMLPIAVYGVVNTTIHIGEYASLILRKI